MENVHEIHSEYSAKWQENAERSIKIWTQCTMLLCLSHWYLGKEKWFLRFDKARTFCQLVRGCCFHYLTVSQVPSNNRTWPEAVEAFQPQLVSPSFQLIGGKANSTRNKLQAAPSTAFHLCTLFFKSIKSQSAVKMDLECYGLELPRRLREVKNVPANFLQFTGC